MFQSIENIRAMAVEQDPWIIVSMDKNDRVSFTPPVWNKLSQIPNVTHIYGHSKNKIDAFNRDVPKEGWDIIVATSDDIKFSHGFDEQIIKDVQDFAITQLIKLQETFDATIWYGDGSEHGKIMTVPIMTKKYYDRLGYLYNPIYVGFFCDEEAIHVGENLGKIYYSQAQIMDHLHPLYGKAEWDPQYRATMPFYHADKKTFERRKALNFPI